MTRTKEPTGVDAYFNALEKIFELQSEILTGVLPHYGERGRNDEERFRDFLTKVLPKKYSVGSGFLICSNPEISMSSQTDVVIFDEIQNSPLHRELAAYVYPAEMVYGTVEVKGLLRSQDLKKIAEDIQKIRRFADQRLYVRYKSKAKREDRPDQRIIDPEEFQLTKTSSRTFVFAYAQKSWKSPEKLVESLQGTLKKTPAHIHALIVLNEGWYIEQEDFSDSGREFIIHKNHALLRFINTMLHSLSSLQMHQASIDRYLRPKIGGLAYNRRK